MNQAILHAERIGHYIQEPAKFSYGYYNKFLILDEAERHILKTGRYPYGQPYSIVQAVEGDQFAAAALSRIVNHQHPNSLKERSADDYSRLIDYGTKFNGKGGMLFYVLQEASQRVVGMGAIEVMSDESDAGSGPEVYIHGKKDNHTQCYLKSLGVLDEVASYRFEKDGIKYGHADELYEARLNVFAQIDRPYLILKTNNSRLAGKCEAKGWINKTRNPDLIPEAKLVFESGKTKDDRAIEVLVLTRETALSWLKQNGTGMTMPELSIIPHASKVAQPAAKQVAFRPNFH